MKRWCVIKTVFLRVRVFCFFLFLLRINFHQRFDARETPTTLGDKWRNKHTGAHKNFHNSNCRSNDGRIEETWPWTSARLEIMVLNWKRNELSTGTNSTTSAVASGRGEVGGYCQPCSTFPSSSFFLSLIFFFFFFLETPSNGRATKAAKWRDLIHLHIKNLLPVCYVFSVKVACHIRKYFDHALYQTGNSTRYSNFCGRLLCGCWIRNPTRWRLYCRIERVHEIFTRKLWFLSFDSLNTT